MAQIFSIYRLTSPSGRTYVGYTGQPVKERVRQHVVKALNGMKHPLSAAIRKYGFDSFVVEVLSTHETSEEAFAEEIRQIAAHPKGYNLSPGGDGDLLAAREAFVKKLEDPVWKAAYGKKLSLSMKMSKLHLENWAKFPARAAKWREENPEEAERIQKKATEAARLVSTGKPAYNKGKNHSPEACTKMALSQRLRWDNATPEMLEQKSASSKRGAKKQWAQRTPEQIAEIGKKISESLKRRNANLTPDELAKRDAILAETRKHIDHDFRLEQQSKSFDVYWTAERRLAKSVQQKAYNAALKAENAKEEECEPTT
jgi:predicted GIY-YIG superfamily endonuclease